MFLLLFLFPLVVIVVMATVLIVGMIVIVAVVMIVLMAAVMVVTVIVVMRMIVIMPVVMVMFAIMVMARVGIVIMIVLFKDRFEVRCKRLFGSAIDFANRDASFGGDLRARLEFWCKKRTLAVSPAELAVQLTDRRFDDA